MNTRFRLPARIALAGAGALLLSAVIWAGSDEKRTEWQKADPNLLAIDLDRGSAGLSRCLAQIRTRASILMVT
ncbi:MAG: hypothetical protein M3Y57_18510, partial [Acidobacteriota bacterium]|nr:hypothetical protein [Acidobacteriota bacterium]